MLTIFTIPKAFRGHIKIIQKNAIQSWLSIHPDVEIILFGNDEGVVETAKQFKIKNYSEVEVNEFGTPLVHTAFNLAQQMASYPLLMYTNSDIIFLSDLLPAIKFFRDKFQNSNFLAVGRRWDVDIKNPLVFKKNDWESKLRNKIGSEGSLHGHSGIDYFIFPRQFQHRLLPFAVGRVGWDNWLIYQTLSNKIPVIDATQFITAVHQNHPSIYSVDKKDPESSKNTQLTGFSNIANISAANFRLSTCGIVKPPLKQQLFNYIFLSYPFRKIISLKRRIQYFLGLG